LQLVWLPAAWQLALLLLVVLLLQVLTLLLIIWVCMGLDEFFGQSTLLCFSRAYLSMLRGRLLTCALGVWWPSCALSERWLLCALEKRLFPRLCSFMALSLLTFQILVRTISLQRFSMHYRALLA
jgi:hypothetical protein